MIAVRGVTRLTGSYLTSLTPVASITAVRNAGSTLFLLAQCRRASRRRTREAASRRATARLTRSEYRHRGRNRAIGPDRDRRRGEELGRVLVEHGVGGRELAEAEVDDPWRAVGIDEHVGAAQVAVRDAFLAQDRHLFPDAAQK